MVQYKAETADMVKVNHDKQKLIKLDTVVYSYDKDVHELTLPICTKDNSLFFSSINELMYLMVVSINGIETKIQGTPTHDGTRNIFVKIPEQLHGYSGKVSMYLYAKLDTNQQLDLARYSFKMDTSEIDQELNELEAFYYQRFEEMIEVFELQAQEIIDGIKVDVDEQIAEIQKQITDVSNQINSTLSELKSKTDLMESEVNTLELQIDGLVTKLGTLETQATELQNQMNELETNVSDVTSIVSGLILQTNALQSQLDTIQSDLSVLLEDYYTKSEVDSLIVDATKNINSSYVDSFSRLGFTNQTNDFCIPQGFTNAKGNLIILYNDYFLPNGTETENVRLSEVKQDGTVLRNRTIELGHGNGISFNPVTNQLLVTKGSVLGVAHNFITEVDYTTLTITREIPTTINYTSIAYDLETERLWAKSGKTINELNPETYSVIKTITIETLSMSQGLLAVNNQLFIPLSNPENILVIDDMGKVLNNYVFGRTTTDGAYINEIEGVAHLGGEQFMFISFAFGSLSKLTTETILTQFNPYSNANQNINRQQFANYPNARIDIYVNAGYLKNDSDGTQARPYTTLNQAFAHVTNTRNMYVIKISAGTYPFSELGMTDARVQIEGTGNVVINGLALNRVGTFNLSGVTLTNASNWALTLDNVTQVKLKNVTTQSVSGSNMIRTFDTQATFENVVLSGGGVVMNNSEIKEYNTTGTATRYFAVTNNSQLTVNSVDIINKVTNVNSSILYNVESRLTALETPFQEVLPTYITGFGDVIGQEVKFIVETLPNNRKRITLEGQLEPIGGFPNNFNGNVATIPNIALPSTNKIMAGTPNIVSNSTVGVVVETTGNLRITIRGNDVTTVSVSGLSYII